VLATNAEERVTLLETAPAMAVRVPDLRVALSDLTEVRAEEEPPEEDLATSAEEEVTLQETAPALTA